MRTGKKRLMEREIPAIFLMIVFLLMGITGCQQTIAAKTNPDEQIVREKVEKYMNALKKWDIPALIDMSGLELNKEIRTTLEQKGKEFLEQNMSVELKDFSIKEVKVDGGIAFVTVEETRKIAPKEGPAPPQLETDYKTVTETIVLIKRDGKWKIDAVNTLHLSELDMKEPDNIPAQLNNLGLGRIATLFMDPDTSNVIVALGVIAVPNFLRARAQGQFIQCQSNMKNIGTALEMYSTDNSGHYPKSLKQVAPDYLRVIPTCAAAGKDTYSESYTSGMDPDCYQFFCKGHFHEAVGAPANYPQYNSNQGLITK